MNKAAELKLHDIAQGAELLKGSLPDLEVAASHSRGGERLVAPTTRCGWCKACARDHFGRRADNHPDPSGFGSWKEKYVSGDVPRFRRRLAHAWTRISEVDSARTMPCGEDTRSKVVVRAANMPIRASEK